MAIIEYKSNDNDFLSQENQRLKALLDSLLIKAEQNEAKQKKFHKLEFELLNCYTLPELCNKLTKGLTEDLQVDAVSLHLFDPHHCIRDLLQEIYADAQISQVSFVDHFFDLESLYNDKIKVQLRPNNPIISQRLFADASAIKSMALIPLTRNKSLIGSLHLGSFQTDRFSPEMSTDFLLHFAQIAAVAIESTVNTDKLKHQSLIDPLTKVKNRRSLFQEMQQEIARAERELHPLSCMFIDLDHFKKINDQFGHDIGDLALKRLSGVIAPNLRATDTLARFGGEEFVVVLPNCDELMAQQIAERVRSTVESQNIKTESEEVLKITCSIGITTWDPVRKVTPRKVVAKALIKTADDAVYQAKSMGRNICNWSPMRNSD